MPDFNLSEHLKEKRSTLSASSIKTYTSILSSLYGKVFGNSDDIDPKKFEDTEKILGHLHGLPPNKRKTILSALVCVTEDKKYRELMLEDIQSYNKDLSKQEKTPEQEESWISQGDVKTVFDKLQTNANLLYKKKEPTPKDLQQIQDYIIMSVLSGVFIAPRRSLDNVSFKIKNINDKEDNFLSKNQFVFNKYKTAKYYNEQRVDVPIQLKNIIVKWIKINPTDFLLFDSNQNALTSVKLNQRLVRILGHKTSVNILRHSYLTSKFGDQIDKNKEMEDVSSEMGKNLKEYDFK